MEMGMLPEEQLAVYLHMDMRIEAERKIVTALQRIMDGKVISTDEIQTILSFVRDAQIKLHQ